MKLIIDIPDNTYKDIMSRDWKNAGWLFSEEWKAIHDGKPLEDELQEIRQEIAEYGSICVEYVAKNRGDRGIELLIGDVLRQAKEQVLDIIDKHISDTGGTE